MKSIGKTCVTDLLSHPSLSDIPRPPAATQRYWGDLLNCAAQKKDTFVPISHYAYKGFSNTSLFEITPLGLLTVGSKSENHSRLVNDHRITQYVNALLGDERIRDIIGNTPSQKAFLAYRKELELDGCPPYGFEGPICVVAEDSLATAELIPLQWKHTHCYNLVPHAFGTTKQTIH